jgi:predicted GNAT family N-acyltransferase
MDAVSTEKFPAELKKLFGNRGFLPVALLGRMAANGNYIKDYREKGIFLGQLLMANCIQKAFDNEVGCVGMIVDAKNEKLVEYYQKYGFIKLVESPTRLFLPRKAAGF